MSNKYDEEHWRIGQFNVHNLPSQAWFSKINIGCDCVSKLYGPNIAEAVMCACLCVR